MPNVSLALLDSAGGIIVGVLQTSVRSMGSPFAVTGALVAGHGSGPHAAAHLSLCSAIARVAGQGIVRAGDAATCGHLALGSSHVRINA